MEKFAVIGSNSFTGATFVKHLLKQSIQVIGFSRSPEAHEAFLPYKWEESDPTNFRFVQADLNNDLDKMLAELDAFQPDYVVNFAAQSMVGESWEFPHHWYQTNVVANVCLHDALRKRSWLKRYVHISTPEVYGSCEGKVGPDKTFNPSTPYATSRAACDMHLSNFYKNYDFPVVFTRAANVYGPGQQLYRIIPRTLLYARLGHKLQLHGGGHSVRAFISADDVAEGTLRAAREGVSSEVYHFSTDYFISIRDLVAKIAEKSGVAFDQLVEISQDRPGKDAAYMLDCSLSEQRLGWKALTSLDKGIAETTKWVDKYFDALKDLPLKYLHKP